jgi:hypothetical protein
MDEEELDKLLDNLKPSNLWVVSIILIRDHIPDCSTRLFFDYDNAIKYIKEQPSKLSYNISDQELAKIEKNEISFSMVKKKNRLSSKSLFFEYRIKLSQENKLRCTK